MSSIKIISGHEFLNEVAKLFLEYKNELNVDVSFQPADETEEEIARRYAEPLGKIYLSLVEEEFAGVIAFHSMNDENIKDLNACEFKRLYVRPRFRGLHIGKLLLKHAIEGAKSIGYHSIYLDTLTNLETACRMYESFNFEQTDPYYYNPLPNVCYYRLSLD